MTTHSLQLATIPFEAIANGTKTIESRLYDEKRQLIQLGDELIFTNREDASQIIKARVIGLLRYETFHDMFTHNLPEKFGMDSVELLEVQIKEFYSPEAQEKYGVIGIEFILV